MDYTELDISISPYDPWAEILISNLAEIGFESFTELNGNLQAYIPTKDYNIKRLEKAFSSLPSGEVKLKSTKKNIQSQNWNAQWESSFEPVVVGQDLVIYAPFHSINKKYKYQIEIQPQMSFGTGHHQTTWLMTKTLLSKNLKGSSVLDVGTGTGVLAILSSQLGAKFILGTDIEQNACENAQENCKRNGCDQIKIIQGDIDCVPDRKFDVIIANINKNVLKNHLDAYAKLMYHQGNLILSGFFETDTDELVMSAKKYNFRHEHTFLKEGWAVLTFIKE